MSIDRKENKIKSNGNHLQSSLELEYNLLFQNRIVSEYIPTKLAASFLGISENALRIRVYRGEIEPLRLGRSLRFRISDLRGLLHEGRR